jgi:hypothetical protein
LPLQNGKELTTARQRLLVEGERIEGREMGVLVYIVFFIVACWFGWAVRGAG